MANKTHVVKTQDLQAGMRVVKPILGKKGDIKVARGEVLSGAHVEKLRKWKGVDKANPRGIEVESTPLHSGGALPDVIDAPWKSPLVEAKSKDNLQKKSFAVPAMKDENGKILNPSPLEKELQKREQNEPTDNKPSKQRGRPKKN